MQISVQDLLAIIGTKEVALAGANAQVATLTQANKELNEKLEKLEKTKKDRK